MEHAPASPVPQRDEAIAPVEPRPCGVLGKKPGRWLGRATGFTLEAIDNTLFDRRLLLPGRLRDRWIVLTYRMDPLTPPLRPAIRFVRAGGDDQDFVLPGVALGSASWLCLMPLDLDAIRLAAAPGFFLERVGLRGHLSVLAECLQKRPFRVVPALYNLLHGDARRYRDILRGACAVSSLARYPDWRAERLRPPVRTECGINLMIRLILPARRSDTAAVGRTLESVLAQGHGAWSLTIAWIGEDLHAPVDHDHRDARITVSLWSDTASTAALLAGSGALGMLCPGDRLRRDALAILAARLAGPDAPDGVYADEEVAGPTVQPRLKPDWSPDFASVTGFTGRPVLFSRALIASLGDRPIGPPDGLALGLAAMSAARSIVHVPRILCTTEPAPEGSDARAWALGRHLVEIGSPARAEIRDGVLDLSWPVPEPCPLASIIIPSRDRLDLIGPVTESVLLRTQYPAIELVIVDNGSTDPAVLAHYEQLCADPRVRIVSYPHPFNFSAMTNAGVREAHGQVLVLLNNDIAVLEPGWLSALVGQAVRPEVGAVGARLLYADGTLQHAGVVVGLGGRAGHILRRRAGDTPGHLGRLCVAHEVSAVTAACLAVERTKYDAVGGLDEVTFPIDFNDVDFCLRLGAIGLKTIWTPKATLSHLESVSRGRPEGEARRRFEREADAFTARWRDVIRHDPFYHPALSLSTFGEDLE